MIGNEPIKSTWMCENLSVACKNEPKGEWACRVTFDFWHEMQVLVHSVQSILMEGQITVAQKFLCALDTKMI